MDDTAIAHTHFPMNFNSWFVLNGKKRITERTLQGVTTHNGSSIFNTVFRIFLWNDCYAIFTVLPETQKLGLPAISRWSVMELSLHVVAPYEVCAVIRFLLPKTNQPLKFTGKCVRCTVTVCLYGWYGDSAYTLPYEFQQLICFGR